jgi:hypothetical protein
VVPCYVYRLVILKLSETDLPQTEVTSYCRMSPSSPTIEEEADAVQLKHFMGTQHDLSSSSDEELEDDEFPDPSGKPHCKLGFAFTINWSINNHFLPALPACNVLEENRVGQTKHFIRMRGAPSTSAEEQLEDDNLAVTPPSKKRFVLPQPALSSSSDEEMEDETTLLPVGTSQTRSEMPQCMLGLLFTN